MLKPLGRNLLVKIEKLEKSSGGLILPGSVQDERKVLRVVAVGSKVEETIVAGDCVVLAGTAGGHMVKDNDGSEFMLVHETNLQALRVFEGES